MNEALKKLIESGALQPQIAEAIEGAWKKALEETEENIREEHAKRYNEDKKRIAEAMNVWLKENLKEEMQELAGNIKGLEEQRIRYAKGRSKLREQYQARLTKESTLLRRFVLEAMKGEMKELAGDHVKLKEERVVLARQLKEAKGNYERELARRVKMLEAFVIENLGKEVRELHEEMKRLSGTRAKVLREGKEKLREFRKDFIQKTAEAVQKFVSEEAKTTFVGMKEEVLEARKNHFGRKVFEAFAAEYMGSYLAEGSAVKGYSKKLQEAEKRNQEGLKKLEETRQKLASAERRISLVEDRAQRTQVLSQLLRPLNPEGRKMMSDLLEGVKTSALKTSYERYLPTVLKEEKPAAKPGKTILKETNKRVELPKKTREVQGNSRNLLENFKGSTDETENFDAEIQSLRKRAGMSR